MNANAVAISALLLGAGLMGASAAHAAVTPDPYGSAHGTVQAATRTSAVAPIQLADGGKGGDKYLSGKAGGAKGIGGTQKDSKKGGK
ncbi:MAG: hypothetical protein ACREEV_11280 [Dongiaceae bacterium]